MVQMVQMSIRIEYRLKEAFFDYCESIGMNMSDVLKKFMVDFLEGKAPTMDIEDFFTDTLGNDESRLTMRIDKELRDKFNAKCESGNIPASFILRGYISKCANYYSAAKWYSDK